MMSVRDAHPGCRDGPATAAPPPPQPFPRPGASARAPGSQPTARRPRRRHASGQPPRPALAAEGAPTEATLGVPIYPGAQFIASYDAGRGQRYYLFGSAASFVDLVTYYRHGAEAEGRAHLRRAGDARVRRRQVPRRDDGVSAGRDDQGLSVAGVAGLSESEARRAAGAVPDDHSDRAGQRK